MTKMTKIYVLLFSVFLFNIALCFWSTFAQLGTEPINLVSAAIALVTACYIRSNT